MTPCIAGRLDALAPVAIARMSTGWRCGPGDDDDDDDETPIGDPPDDDEGDWDDEDDEEDDEDPLQALAA